MNTPRVITQSTNNEVRWRVAALVLFASLGTMHANGQTAQTEIKGVSIDDPRPVQAAVASLLESYPVTITYEDPKYEFADDIVDVTDQMPSKPEVRVLGPRGGILQASYETSKDTGWPVSMTATLEGIVAAKNVSDTGGRFRVEQRGDVFHVVPAETKDAHGAWVARGSILEVPISISATEMSGIELLDLLVKTISEAAGTTIQVSANAFVNSLVRYRGTVEAKNEPARDVLVRVLHAVSPRFTWLLDYDPTFKFYVLNIALAAATPPKEIPLDLSKIPKRGDPTPAGPPKR